MHGAAVNAHFGIPWVVPTLFALSEVMLSFRCSRLLALHDHRSSFGKEKDINHITLCIPKLEFTSSPPDPASPALESTGQSLEVTVEHYTCIETPFAAQESSINTIWIGDLASIARSILGHEGRSGVAAHSVTF